MKKERTYAVKYREKREKAGQVFETSVTAKNNIEARELAKEDLESKYTIISVRKEG